MKQSDVKDNGEKKEKKRWKVKPISRPVFSEEALAMIRAPKKKEL